MSSTCPGFSDGSGRTEAHRSGVSAEAAEIRRLLRAAGQDHLLAFEAELSPAARGALYRQIRALDFAELARLVEESRRPVLALDPSAIEPAQVIELPRTPAELSRQQEARAAGLAALKAGKVAALMVAGGQGSRLGFDSPKGMFPIGPVSGASLFQVHAEKISAWRRHCGAALPWYIMTSPATHDATLRYFAEQRYFGLPPEDVVFFSQGTMPAVDARTGQVLLAGKGELFASPNGHGGVLLALRSSGILDELARRGIELVHYFQVDNVFVRALDPESLGRHELERAEMSAKVVRKEHAAEKVGLVVRYHGRPTVIEYSDLPAEIGAKVDASGRLRHWAGSIAIHVFSRSFLEKMTDAAHRLPYHFAWKKVPYVDAAGMTVAPNEPNAIKFEQFVFDAMPLAERVAIVETDRHEEYEPLKNATGEHSPRAVQQAMLRRAGAWLRQAGIGFPTNDAGELAVPVEISPLAGLTPEEFAGRFGGTGPIVAPTRFAERREE